MFTSKAINSNSVLTKDLQGKDVYFTPFDIDWLEKDLSGIKQETDLTAAYPKAVECTIQFKKQDEGVGGSFYGTARKMVVSCAITDKVSETIRTLVHEMQHLLQYLDGRVYGSNSYVAMSVYKSQEACNSRKEGYRVRTIIANSRYLEGPDIKAFQKRKKAIAEVMRKAYFDTRIQDVYRANIGEIEARLAEAQLNEFPGWVRIKEIGIVKWKQCYLNGKQSFLDKDFLSSVKFGLINGKTLEDLTQEIQTKKVEWDLLHKEAEERSKEREEKACKEKQALLCGYSKESLEKFYWGSLGDSYREPMSKTRTNYKR